MCKFTPETLWNSADFIQLKVTDFGYLNNEVLQSKIEVHSSLDNP
ncbi:hypothetical protein TRICHSKD4_5238 [Roseibium sp. TrichSKD4]|nr:hypothetical protein TRICHSKD4_5238 [Roseibium sp. TrichSKD4]